MFRGFSEQTLEFLWGIRFNNDRAWFQDHKAVYLDALYDPMTDLADELLASLREARPHAGLIRRVTRIYRDARRLYGRGPYKDHLWLTVRRPAEEWQGDPAFWFEVTPDGWSYGLGYWRPRPVAMAKIRGKISRDPAEMEKLMRRLRRQDEFALETIDYKRPKGTPPSDLLAPWYRARSLMFSHEGPWTEELYGREIADRLIRGSRDLLPFFDWLSSVDAEPDPVSDPPKAP